MVAAESPSVAGTVVVAVASLASLPMRTIGSCDLVGDESDMTVLIFRDDILSNRNYAYVMFGFECEYIVF